MTDGKDHKETPVEEEAPGASMIIDATAHRRPRVHGLELDHNKGTVRLDFLADVPLKVNVVLAETSMPLGEILALGTDSIVQLDKPSGDPVDIYVENQMLGRGEVIVLQEKLRIRLIEITPPSLSAEGKTPDKPEEQ